MVGGMGGERALESNKRLFGVAPKNKRETLW